MKPRTPPLDKTSQAEADRKAEAEYRKALKAEADALAAKKPKIRTETFQIEVPVEAIERRKRKENPF